MGQFIIFWSHPMEASRIEMRTHPRFPGRSQNLVEMQILNDSPGRGPGTLHFYQALSCCWCCKSERPPTTETRTISQLKVTLKVAS